MDTTEFVEKYGIEMKCEKVPQNPHIEADDDWARQASHWFCRFSMPGYEDRDLTTYFSMGSALTGPPGVADVLDSLASDAASVADVMQFEDWAEDVGYDPDSRKAERTYNVIIDQAARLEKFLGSRPYEELLHETERL